MVKKCSEIIRGLREDRDLKQADVAKVINTSQQQYSKYETEYAEIPIKVLMDLADFYNVSTDFLLGRVSHSGSLADLEVFIKSNPRIAKMLSDIQKLSTASQNAVLEYIRLQMLKEKADTKAE